MGNGNVLAKVKDELRSRCLGGQVDKGFSGKSKGLKIRLEG